MSALDHFPSEHISEQPRYAVDRSRLASFSEVLQLFAGWQPLGGLREAKNHEIRQQTTMQDKLEAWRGICALPEARA